jgi:hypothetical protein
VDLNSPVWDILGDLEILKIFPQAQQFLYDLMP